MSVYEYVAKDKTGNKLYGTYSDINNVAVLREELAKVGYVLLKAKRGKASTKKRKKIKRSEVVAFAYKFSGMYSAGLSIVTCLQTLEEQADNQSFKCIITDIKQGIETGSSLKSAFEKYRNIFSDFFLGMIEAGETGGKLSEALEMSARYLEKQADLKRKVKSAFAYPIAVSIVCLIVIFGLLVFIVPVFSKMYKQLHVSLPGPTQALIDLSNLITNHWWAILILTAPTIIILQRLVGEPAVKEWWDYFKLNMPVFAKLNRMVVISKFTRTLAMLASVGLSLIEALDVASQVAHNQRLTKISEELQAAVKTGSPLAASMGKYDIFPPMITQLTASGEQAGRLPEMLSKGADFIEKDIDRIIHALLVKLEPTLTLIMGIIVGFLLMAVYLPMFDYMSHLK